MQDFCQSSTNFTPAEITNGCGQTIQEVTLHSVKAAITALVNGGQTGATPLPSVLNEISVCGSSGDSCLLPKAKAGMVLMVANAGAAPCNIFPASGEKINGGSADAAFSLVNAKRALFFCVVDGNWYTNLTA